jgi:glycosyltransferase involved in cell wall biosynthesis
MLAERHSDLRTTVLGPADVNDALRFHAAALRIGDIVEIVEATGDRPADRERVARAELGVVLAEEDDAAFAVLDCWAAGVPVIAERSALLEAFVTTGETGVLTARLEAAGLAAIIAGLLADHPRQDALARASRAAAVRWPVSTMCEGFERAARSAHDRSRGRV